VSWAHDIKQHQYCKEKKGQGKCTQNRSKLTAYEPISELEQRLQKKNAWRACILWFGDARSKSSVEIGTG
jgi:hypothetical protein